MQGTQLKICVDKEPEEYEYSILTKLKGLGLVFQRRKKQRPFCKMKRMGSLVKYMPNVYWNKDFAVS